MEFTATPAIAPVSLSSRDVVGTSFMFFVEMVVADPAKADLRVFPYPVMTTSLITCSSACRVIFISPEAMGSLSLL